ncbi:unnamed protein product [Rhodiola kirilowii]
MKRKWMSSNRLSVEYEEGIKEFCEFALGYAFKTGTEYVHCLCSGCFNNKKVTVKNLHKHLLLKGIDPRYRVWYMHGEVQNVEPQCVENLPENNNDLDEDNLVKVDNNIADEFVATPQVLESLKNDSELPVYEGCTKYTRLSAKLFNLKARNGWSDKSFSELLTLVKDMLPRGNTLPNRIRTSP